MARIRLERAVVERAFETEHDALARELGEQGWLVIEPRRGYEQRSLGAAAIAAGSVALWIHLETRLPGTDLQRLVDTVAKHLRRPRRDHGPPRVAHIVGPDGGRIATVDLDGEESDAA